MVIDCHGHYTTAPKQLNEFRQKQLARFESEGTYLDPQVNITDDEIRESLENNQLKIQAERGVDLTIFSPTAGAMAHHHGDARISADWSRACNDLIHRAVSLYPSRLAGVCQLPQSPGVSPGNCVAELTRCVEELGFVGCNLNPDPSDGYWTDPPLTARHWYPLFEKLVELDVPAMIHVSCSCNPNFHHTGAHYLNGDTTAFMQFIQGDVFKDFPTLRFIIPHGGGAVPYHWGRYRGLAQNLGRPPLQELLNNVFFDTCVYHQPGVDLLLNVIPAENILFASEIVGAVKGIDPTTGHFYDDTKRYIDAVAHLSADDRNKIMSGNALRVYPRLRAQLEKHNVL
ncbi:amidohydrolase family protein [Orrella marina]|uniref:4-oxalomesaconate hydratase n=1 Tax=Orrella marina TaxID=2163011 RepID=A0A2R4XPN1_9BURK|nr:amidohydrolase family protein [Orrella marina]AWB35774.1 4-oxalomesaconate hydratase [Orrella marina]